MPWLFLAPAVLGGDVGPWRSKPLIRRGKGCLEVEVCWSRGWLPAQGAVMGGVQD